MFGVVYVIFVVFYISLFVVFVFDCLFIFDMMYIKLFISGLFVIIMVVVWFWGVRGLEIIELFVVIIKLVIIVGVFVVLVIYDI